MSMLAKLTTLRRCLTAEARIIGGQIYRPAVHSKASEVLSDTEVTEFKEGLNEPYRIYLSKPSETQFVDNKTNGLTYIFGGSLLAFYKITS